MTDVCGHFVSIFPRTSIKFAPCDNDEGGADVKIPESQRDDSAVMLVGPRPYYTHTERIDASWSKICRGPGPFPSLPSSPITSPFTSLPLPSPPRRRNGCFVTCCAEIRRRDLPASDVDSSPVSQRRSDQPRQRPTPGNLHCKG